MTSPHGARALSRCRQDCRLVDELIKNKRTGAIVALGSPVVNAVTDSMAEKMLEGLKPNDAPAKFLYSFDLPQPAPCLVKKGRVPHNEVGIRLRNHQITTFRRTHNDELFQQVTTGGARGPFEDCGMLMIDHRGDHCPLVICAGHGGCGTVAAVLALTCGPSAGRIERGLDGQCSVLGPGRVFEIVTVKRTKPTGAKIDDLKFDEEFQKGWDFGLQ